MNNPVLESASNGFLERKLSFLDLEALKLSEKIFFEGKTKLKAKILTTLEQDIDKFRIAADLDLFVKLKFLKFLTSALIFYGPEDAISLIEKTITTFAELKRRNVMYLEDRIFNEFLGACNQEIFDFCCQKLQREHAWRTLFLREYNCQYLSLESSGSYHGFQHQALGVTSFLYYHGNSHLISNPDFLNEKIFSGSLAKHLKEFLKSNLYSQIFAFSRIKDDPKVLKNISSHIARLAQQNINSTDLLSQLFLLQVLVKLKEDPVIWKPNIKKLAERFGSRINSASYDFFEKQSIFLLLTSIEQQNSPSINLNEMKMRLLPFEDPEIKLRKITTMFQSHNSNEKFTPLYICNILNHFQSYGCLSSNAPLFQTIWRLFLSFLFATSSFQSLDKNLEFIITLLEEKPRLNSQFILLLKEINKLKHISHDIHEKLKAVFLQKHFEDLKQHLLIIDYLIDQGFYSTLIDSLNNFKRMFLSGESNEKEVFIIARSLFHLVRVTSPRNDASFINQIIQILQEIIPIDSAYIKEECQLLSEFLQILPQDTMQDFLDTTKVETKECFSLLSQEGHAESPFTREQFHYNFDFSIFSHQRKERGINDNGVSFVLDNLENPLLPENNSQKVEEITSLEQIHIFMENLVQNFQKHYFHFQIKLQRKSCDSHQKLSFPPEIFNMEFNFPSSSNVASIHIPYLSSTQATNPATIEASLVFDFHSYEPGSLEALVSFTNSSGDIYYGTVPLVPLKFQDFFIHSPTPPIKFKDEISQELPNSQLSEAESFQLFFYHHLQQKHCKYESFKIIRQPMEHILAKFASYLKFFEVHAPYHVSDQDSLGLEYQNILYPKSKKSQISSTLKLKTQQQTILRAIIKLPAKNYLLMYFKVKKSQSEINIYTTTSDVFKYLDEYFNMWS